MNEYIKYVLKDYLVGRMGSKDSIFDVKKDDKFIVSYPKSGNTWVRFLVGNLIFNKEMNLLSIEDLIPDIYKKSLLELNNFREKNKINIFKTHSAWRPKYAGNEVIYIVRDARDIVVSYYYYYQKVNQIRLEFDDFFDKFVNREIFPQVGTWGENVGSWIGGKKADEDNFLLIRFEDLKEDTRKEVDRICDFLGLTVSEKEKRESIESSSFENLKRMEKEMEDVAPGTKDTDKNIKFFRKGETEQWRNMLNSRQQKILIEEYGEVMNELGYSTNFEVER